MTFILIYFVFLFVCFLFCCVCMVLLLFFNFFFTFLFSVIFYYYFLFASFFFSKQKTAYELRISDWSSDVCSSDLAWHFLPGTLAGARSAPRPLRLVLVAQRPVEGGREPRRLASRDVERRLHPAAEPPPHDVLPGGDRLQAAMAAQMVEPALADRHMADLVVEDHLQDIGRGIVANAAQPRDHRRRDVEAARLRSEEHTSELQSQMRISY